jgi:hypothetical protein
MQALAFLASLAVPSAGVLFALLASFAVGCMEAKRADPCTAEIKALCDQECVTDSCKRDCTARPTSHWVGKAPSCR